RPAPTSKESTTQGGTFTISSPDGIASLTIDGHAFITNGVFTASSFTTARQYAERDRLQSRNRHRQLYLHAARQRGHATGASTNSLFENLAVSLTDQDGQNATGTLSVNIVDDVPTAVADIDSIGAGLFGPATGMCWLAEPMPSTATRPTGLPIPRAPTALPWSASSPATPMPPSTIPQHSACRSRVSTAS
ncbi:hypothetical protein, partial [Mesorhizobium sp. C268A]|uniref:hypothetical protein n=1 Tax=Mesorhizobium sp. C268A TaxID=2956826 RepID=UPI00333B3D36